MSIRSINSGSLLLAKGISSQFLGAIIAFAFALVGARLMPVNEFGDLRFVMTLLPILMAIALPGYDSIILKNILLKKQVNLLAIFFERVSCGLVGSIGIFVYIFLFPNNLDASLKFLFIITASLLPLYETGTGYKNFLIAHRLRNSSLSLVLTVRISTMVLFLISVLSIVIFHLDPLYVYPAFLLSSIVPTLIVFFRVAFSRFTVGRALTKVMRGNYLLPAMLISFGSSIYTFGFSLDKFVIYHKLGASSLAIYSILTMIPVELAKTFDSLVPLFYRKLFFSKDTKLNVHYGLGLSVLLTLFVLYVVLFHFLSPIVFGVNYEYNIYLVFMAGMLFFSSCVEMFYVHKIFAKKKQAYYLLFSLANLAISALLLNLGVELAGLYGLIPCLFFKQLFFAPAFASLTRGND